VTPAELVRFWRVGRRVGRTIYAIAGTVASDADVLIGVMDTRELARHVVDVHNAALAAGEMRTTR
jgi:hypothetical protein